MLTLMDGRERGAHILLEQLDLRNDLELFSTLLQVDELDARWRGHVIGQFRVDHS